MSEAKRERKRGGAVHLSESRRKELEARFNALMKDQMPRVRRVALRVTCSVQDAEDVVVTTFQKLWEAMVDGTLREDCLDMQKRWLHSAAHNNAIDLLRAKSRRIKSCELTDDIIEIIPGPDKNGVLEEEDGDFAQMLSRVGLRNVTEKELRLLHLRIAEKEKFKDISVVMGKSEAAIKSEFLRLLKRVRIPKPA
jgi:RNA polymerase sigma factor (sigma-70 family)